MRVQHNRVAMNRYNSMTKTANNMQKMYEKLSSSYRINGATGKISTERSKFGSYMNVLEHIDKNVGIYKAILSASKSRIRDADMAEHMMSLTKDQVILQSAQSMMAQVNQMSQGILQLLK